MTTITQPSTPSLEQQDFGSTSGNWDTQSLWVDGQLPTASQDVAIGVLGDVGVVLNANATVNSVAVNAGSVLSITDATLLATDGSETSPTDTHVLAAGNFGVIDLEDNGVLEFGDSFINEGTIDAVDGNIVVNGDATLVGPGAVNVGANINFDKSLTVSGKGSINLGLNGELGNISSTVAGSDFTNVDDTISGGGAIQASGFDNQAGGTFNAGLAADPFGGGNIVGLTAPAVSNEGVINVLEGTRFFLGSEAANGSLSNTGQINLGSFARLDLQTSYTISGGGVIALNGANSDIGGESNAEVPTHTNESTIEGLSSQAVLGDNVGDNLGFVTLVNRGSVVAEGSGDELIVNTGANVIQDAGGLLEAEEAGHLVIDSAVDTGSTGLIGGPSGGTIEAIRRGVVTIASSVSDGVKAPEHSLPGQIVIDGGTVEFLSTASDSVPIEFTGFGGVLQVHSAATALGPIQGLADGDAVSVTGTSLKSVAIGSTSLDIVTNAGRFDFADVSYDGAVTGFVAFADPFTPGLERVILTHSDIPVLQETDSTVFEGASDANIIGKGDTIDFLGSAASTALLGGTGGEADRVNGSGGVIKLDDAQARVFGGSDTIDFLGPTGNQVSLFATDGHQDAIKGAAGTVDLDGATAKATNNGDTFEFDASNTLDLLGTAETMAFSHGIGGLDSIKGVGSSDVFEFSKADFADFAVLQEHMKQSGANTVISLSASDAVTLVDVAVSTLHAGQFKFV